MKRNLLITLSLIALFAVCAICAVNLLRSITAWSGKVVRTSGQLSTKCIPIPDFEAIHASRAVKVVLAEEAPQICIEADDKLLEWVIVESDDGELEISIDPKIKSIKQMNVTVTVPVGNREIRSLRASSAARIEGDITLQSPELKIDASSSARIRASVQSGSCSAEASSNAHIDLTATGTECRFNASSAARITAAIEAESCEASVSSASKIRLSGSAERFTAQAGSAGKIDAEKLATTRASVHASSGSGINVTCSGELRAEASSGSSIRYGGDCRLEATKSSGGSIRKN